MTTSASIAQGSGERATRPAIADSPPSSPQAGAPAANHAAGDGGRDGALEERVDEMMAAAQAGAAGGAPAPLVSLDEELAALADDLVSGAVEDAESLLAAAQPVAVARPAADKVAEVLVSEPPAPPARPVVARAPVEPQEDAIKPVPVAVPSGRAPEPEQRPETSPPRTGLLVVAAGAPKRLAAAASAPLAGRSPLTRQLVGYVALMQLFFAACLWSYVLVVRGPGPAGAHGATLLASGHAEASGEHPPGESGTDHAGTAHAEGHASDALHRDQAPAKAVNGQKGSSHAEPKGDGHAPKADAHAPSKSDGHGASKSDSHGATSDGHGKAEPKKDGPPKPGARSAEVLGAKRPGVKSSTVMPARPTSKTAAQAGGGHGDSKPSGGH